MKRLFLILIFVPVILLGHLNAQVVSDSEANANLRGMAALIANDLCARVAEIRLSDDGVFGATFVFYHGISASDTVYFTPQNSGTIAGLKTDEPTALVSMPVVVPPVAGKTITEIKIEPVKEEAVLQEREHVVMSHLELWPAITFNTDNMPPAHPRALVVQDVVVRASHEADSLAGLKFSGLAQLDIKSLLVPMPAGVTVPDIVIRPLRDSDLLASASICGLTEIPNVNKILPNIVQAPLPDMEHSQAFDTVGALILDGALHSVLGVTGRIAPQLLGAVVPDIAASGAFDTVGAQELTNAHLAYLAEYRSDISVAPVELPLKLELRTDVADMHLSPDGYALLEKMEGFAPTLYNLGDGGYTIGFGFFVPFNEGYKWKNGVTWEQAVTLIEQKVPAYEDQVKKYINVSLTQSEFDALTMLAYNIGGFSKATSLINDINAQVDIGKIQNDWNRFIHSKAPNVTKGLMKRRKDEIEVKKLSDYQPTRKIQILKGTK